MFEAHLISLGSGQSYRSTPDKRSRLLCLVPDDHPNFDIPDLFEEYTFSFICNNKKYISHHFNVKVIWVTRDKPKVSGIGFSRVVINDNIIYGPGLIVEQHMLDEYGLPKVFENDKNDFSGQLTMIVKEGVIIVPDFNVVSLELEKNENRTFGIQKVQEIDKTIILPGVVKSTPTCKIRRRK